MSNRQQRRQAQRARPGHTRIAEIGNRPPAWDRPVPAHLAAPGLNEFAGHGRFFGRYDPAAGLLWELEYPGGTIVREPLDNASIRDTRKGAAAIYLVTHAGDRLVRVSLHEDGHTYLPIFYRRRSMAAGAGAEPARTDATIIGRAREATRRATDAPGGFESVIDGLLLAAALGEIRDCPDGLQDFEMIALQCDR